MKINLILLFIYLLFINVNKSQLIEITTSNTLSLSIENPNYSKNFISSYVNYCLIEYQILVFNNGGLGSYLSDFKTTSSIPSLLKSSNDNSTYLYSYNLQVQMDTSLIINLTLTSNNLVQTIYQLNQTCNNVLKENKVVELDVVPFVFNDGFYSLFPVKEEDNDLFLAISSQGDLVYTGFKNYFFMVWGADSTNQGKSLTDKWNRLLSFSNGKTLNITSRSYWDYFQENELPNQPSEISFYPSGLNSSNPMFTDFGSYNAPFVKVKIESEIIKPYFYLCFDFECTSLAPLKPIKGIKGNMTYVSYMFNQITEDYHNYSLSIANKYSITNSIIKTKFKRFKLPLLNINVLESKLQDNPIPLFSIAFNNTSPFKFTTTLYSFNYRNSIIGWPFGFLSGNNLNHTRSITFQKYIDSKEKTSFSFMTPYLGDGPPGLIIDSSENVVNNPPQMISYKFIRVQGFVFILSIDFTSINGIQYFAIDSSVSKSLDNLVKGDIYKGTFEIVIDAVFEYIKLVDTLNFQIYYKLGDIISFNPILRFENPLLLKSLDHTYFDDLWFSTNELDLIDKDNYIIAYINSSKMPQDLLLSSYILDVITQTSIDTNPIIYNSTLGLFTSKFIVKKNNIFGEIFFYFQHSLSGFFLNNAPNSTQLMVNSTVLDNEGPIFSKIETIGNETLLDLNNVNGVVGWNFTITDYLNGFDRGYIKVMGSLDSSTFNFNFTFNDFISGNKFEGVYQLLIPVSTPCSSQQYQIVYVELYDTNQILSKFEPYTGFSPLINPFMYLYENSEDGGYSLMTMVSVLCPSFPEDPSKPVLLSFTSSKSIIDVGLIDRSVTFTFEIIPSQSGIRKNQSPIIYMTSKRLESFECVSKLTDGSNITYAKYTCTTQLPLSFGYPGEIILSVYGIINNGGHYHGFSTVDLLSTSSKGYISTSMTVDQPILTSNLKYYSDDKELTILGRSLSNINKVLIKDVDTESINQTLGIESISFYGSSGIKISNIIPNDKLFDVLVISNSTIESNKLRVSPVYFNLTPSNIEPPITPTPSTPTPSTPIPTNPPQPCPGKPMCGGEKQGYCSAVGTGCICVSPWIGLDCSSKVIIVPPPVINNTDPSVVIPTIPIDENSSISNELPEVLFKSLISLVSIREIDFNEKQVTNHIFDKWIYTPITELKNQYKTSVLNTNITATLEWFNTSTDIEFANQKLTMNPSTIKYTIEVTGEYKFANALNQLQLIMFASFESSKTNEICSNTQFGNTSTGDNSNFLKIQIDNHSLYGRFIKRAIIDGEFRSVSNKLLDSSLNSINSASSIQTYIAITVPQFKNQIIIDPDFSVLLDFNDASSNGATSICNNSSSDGLSTSQLVGIIIGSVAFLLVIIISITYN
ncbi:EGF-like domain-containing protein [Dictyostelium discoideum AX4]|uniref:EGF-like domain-containing protein n=1 Tax=Dictyostelium discoideum TaxID=44689 RepID=Q55CD8_DICDI|nr:EGF-like domain-containing protein [Dictyostelium discoideum AX4]EAL72866.1 EGF-like domain-containing protein [Dictyostelium discoideum AX4]|eukprot:XP_646543.1 EGF-like domain-containing protein [Dictyostelium discoideum AX4]